MIRIGIILGSTRPGRLGDQVATWVQDVASGRSDATFTLIDLRDHPLPHLEEGPLARTGPSEDERIRAWSEAIAACDGFVIVTPEYNRSAPGVLKNALDHLQPEWHDKAVGFVSYGIVGGARAVEQLRLVCAALQMADVSQQVALSLFTEFTGRTTFAPGGPSGVTLDALLDQVVAWSTALAPLRGAPDAAA